MLGSLLSLSAAAKICPGQPAPTTVWRWCRRGVRSRNGERVRLNHVRIGGKVFTTRKDLDEFFAALTAADLKHFGGTHTANTAQARRERLPHYGAASAVERASRELDQAGI